MNTPDMDSRFLATVSRLKQAELSYRSRLGWSVGVWFIVGVVVGLGTWFSLKPMDRDETAFGGALGLGLATFFFFGMLSRMLIRKPGTKCPQCGSDWQMSGDYSHSLLTWKCCPGCGLKMSSSVRRCT